MSAAAKTREDAANVTRKHKCLSIHRGDLRVKHSTLSDQEKRKMDTIGERRETIRDCRGYL